MNEMGLSRARPRKPFRHVPEARRQCKESVYPTNDNSRGLTNRAIGGFVGLLPAKDELAQALAHLETGALLFVGRVVDPTGTG